MTDILRATSAADFLSAIPVMLGYQPKNSIVCVAFRGRRTGEVFRVDVPPRRLSNQKAVAATIIGTLSRLAGLTGATVIMYTDETFEVERGIPQLELGRLLASRIHGAGFDVPDVLCVAGDGWASYFDTDYPRAGHPLSEISDSEIASRTAHFEVMDDISHVSALPERDPVAAARLEHLIDAFERYTDEGLTQLDRLAETVDLDSASVACAIAEEADPTPELSAWMMSMAQNPSDRDVITLTVAFGRAVGQAALESNAHYHRLQAQTGKSMDEVVQREVSEGRLDLDADDNLLGGRGPRQPDVPRAENMIDLLKRLIANVPDHYRPGPLCILSWLQWSLGRSSAAAIAAELALAIEPDHGMARLLHAMYRGGLMPEWAFGGRAA